jgi:hypothetical protein
VTLRRVVGAAGLVAAAALLVHRCDDAPPSRAAQPTVGGASTSPESTRSGTTPPRQIPRTTTTTTTREDAPPAPARTFRFRTAAGDTVEDQALQQATRTQLTKFKDDASLSDVQMQHLLGDLADLAALHASTTETGLRGMSDAERIAFWTDLGVELELRMAGYLNEAQLAEFRFRFVSHALIAQVSWQRLLEEVP